MHPLWNELPADWQAILTPWLQRPEAEALGQFVVQVYGKAGVHPDRADLFAALHATPWSEVKVVIVGQDPYPTPGHAHGLSFSVRPGVPLPRSLRNMYQELQADLGDAPLPDGNLLPWARQGVLLLNTVLTVGSGEAGSHRRKGWEGFTAEILRQLIGDPAPKVFILWGNDAAKLGAAIGEPHTVISSAHPSPLSARRGFFGSAPFSRANQALVATGRSPIQWGA